MGRFFKKFFNVIENTIASFINNITAPFRSVFHAIFGNKSKNHPEIKYHSTPTEEEKKVIEDNKKAKKTSRNIYLSDYGDTVANWDTKHQSVLEKVGHNLLSRPDGQKIPLFDGQVDLIKDLNKKGVKTAIISNGNEASLHKEIGHPNNKELHRLFDAVVGHDRNHDFFARKPGEKISKITVEKLIGTEIRTGMKPVNVIFVGDSPQDIAAANTLDRLLKDYNVKSCCEGILLNSQGFTEVQLAALSGDEKPIHVANDYADIRKIVDKFYSDKDPKTGDPTAKAVIVRTKDMAAQTGESLKTTETKPEDTKVWSHNFTTTTAHTDKAMKVSNTTNRGVC